MYNQLYVLFWYVSHCVFREQVACLVTTWIRSRWREEHPCPPRWPASAPYRSPTAEQRRSKPRPARPHIWRTTLTLITTTQTITGADGGENNTTVLFLYAYHDTKLHHDSLFFMVRQVWTSLPIMHQCINPVWSCQCGWLPHWRSKITHPLEKNISVICQGIQVFFCVSDSVCWRFEESVQRLQVCVRNKSRDGRSLEHGPRHVREKLCIHSQWS